MQTIDKKIEFYKKITRELNLWTVYNNVYLDNFFPFRIKTKEEILRAWKNFLSSRQDPFLSLYTHIPFCKNSRCFYCMYNSKVLINSFEVDVYLDFLQKSIMFFSPVFSGHSFSTLYIGGGTPSVMSVKQIQRLLVTLFRYFKFKENVGMRCMEFSPATITEAKIAAAKDNGITRISMGIQSLDRDVLRCANRKVVSFDFLKRIVGFIEKQGFFDFNIDLMAWLPSDSIEKFSRSFEKMLQLRVPSITIYFFRYIPHRFKMAASVMGDTPYFDYQFPYNRDKLEETILSLLKGYPYDPVWKIANTSECWVFRLKGHSIRNLKISPTQPDYFLGNSMFGLGLYARSFLGGDIEYYNADNQITNFDFDKKIYSLKKYSLDYQMRRFVLWNFEAQEKICLDSFQRYFHRDFMDVFKKEVEILKGLNKIFIKDGKVSFLSKDIFEHAVYSKFFYDQEILKKAAKSINLK